MIHLAQEPQLSLRVDVKNWGISPKHYVMETSVTAGAYKAQVLVGNGVPAFRVEASGIHGVV